MSVVRTDTRRTFSPPRLPRAIGSRARVWLTRLMTLLLLAVAVPGSAEVVEELVSLATGVDCCGEDCADHEGGCEPKSCVHSCCAHVTALVATALRVPRVPVADGVSFKASSERASSAGYRAPPFRPPAG